jgi:hypothetical protein
MVVVLGVPMTVVLIVGVVAMRLGVVATTVLVLVVIVRDLWRMGLGHVGPPASKWTTIVNLVRNDPCHKVSRCQTGGRERYAAAKPAGLTDAQEEVGIQAGDRSQNVAEQLA